MSSPEASQRVCGAPSPGSAQRSTSIDRDMTDLAIDPDEWDILYRIRLQTERDILVGAAYGSDQPAVEPALADGVHLRPPAPGPQPAPVATVIEAPHTT